MGEGAGSRPSSSTFLLDLLPEFSLGDGIMNRVLVSHSGLQRTLWPPSLFPLKVALLADSPSK